MTGASVTGAQWFDATAYEQYIGRWSRRVAEVFVPALAVPVGRDRLDAGCGTGALTDIILTVADPARVVGVDMSPGYVEHARDRVGDDRAEFRIGDAQDLPVADRAVDVVVSALTLNFIPDPQQAAVEFRRVLRPGGIAAAYVWDYADGMAMTRTFWDVAIEGDPPAAARLPVQPDGSIPLTARAWTVRGRAA
jgi:ubiquinone/menaquinone biosynthesis C-methylase UbiE